MFEENGLFEAVGLNANQDEVDAHISKSDFNNKNTQKVESLFGLKLHDGIKTHYIILNPFSNRTIYIYIYRNITS